MSKIKKAIIIAAGYGTRRLPITKVVDKCMLPIGNRPLIDFVVEDCIKAGVEEIIFVISEGSNQIKEYYTKNTRLEEYLSEKSDLKNLQVIQELEKKAKFRFVVQKSTDPYGTAVPMWLCRDYVETNEKFLYISGDQFYFDKNDNTSSESGNLIKQFSDSDLDGAMLAVEVPREEVYKYGIVSTRPYNNLDIYSSIIEKPRIEDAPTNLNNGTMWLLDSDIFEHINSLMGKRVNGEYNITDVVNQYADSDKKILVVRARGKYLDGGSELGWLEANNFVLT